MDQNKYIAELRQSYAAQILSEDKLDQDPLIQFAKWFHEAVNAGITEPNAMTLATVNERGYPSARVVLLKGIEHGGFVFYTNYESHKGQQLAANPRAALAFWWEPLFRQVRIEGITEKVSTEVSTAYFQSRPRGSQIGAWASPQSQVISGRALLEQQVEKLEEKYAGQEVLPLPPHWGGYVLKPEMIEFWQGQENRLHDRWRYSLKTDGKWQLERLAP